jgi:antitoxin component HigA of HigAB toxin-antitoxin module
MERLKILRAAAALGTFTVEALAEYAGVNVATAQTVLSREQDLFIRRGTVATGRAGGQPAIYGVVADALRQRIDAEGAAHPAGEIPLALAAGYDTLLRRLPETDDRFERAELVTDAKLALRLARDEWPDPADTRRLELHDRCFSALVQLVKLEDGPALDTQGWEALCVELAEVSVLLQEHDELALAAALGVRALRSRMQQRTIGAAARARPAGSRPPAHSTVEEVLRGDLYRAAREG